MARKYSKAKKARKYSKVKKGRKVSKTIIKQNGNNPFPMKFQTKLRYIDDINHTGNFFSHYIYRGNSLFDPDATSTGHQPLGYDTLCGASKTNAPYLTYNVMDAYFKIDIINTSATVPFYVIIYAAREAGVPGTTTEAFEQQFSKYTVVGINSSVPSKRLFIKVKTAQIFGETTSAVKSEDSYSAPYNTNPANVWYYHVYLIACDGSSNITARTRIELIYNAEFSDRNQLIQS